MRALLLFATLGLVGCTSDALYSFCTDGAQCGSRTYEDGDREIEIRLECIEVSVEVEPGRTTVGTHCTLPCFASGDCSSTIGLETGRCIMLAGDDEAFCYQRCDTAECYPSSACETLTVGGEDVRVCVPTRVE